MKTLTLMLTLTTLTACIQERGEVEYYRCQTGGTSQTPPPATSDGSYTPSGAYGLQAADGKTIFERDVLPLLSSTDTGKVYKCTVCHAAFADPANLSQPGRIDALVERMTLPAAQQGFMPVNGDTVAAADIEVFKSWQAGGYLTAATAGEPTEPTVPTEPTEPTEPTDPTGPTEPSTDGYGGGNYGADGSAYDKPAASAKPAGC